MLCESQWYTQMPEKGVGMDYYGEVLSPYLFPEFKQQHPWNKGGACDKDFILISEFCEQEGPKPLITIPTDEGSHFDKNEFVVRIMAVDHQTTSSGFSLLEDTQVMMTELKTGTYAYVHHFTLFDHHARGYVRPFCMTYVTADPRKIMSFYEDLSSEFNKVSRYFKYGNRKVFAMDLENQLRDLAYTRERVIEVQCKSTKSGEITLSPEEKFLRECSLDSVDQAIQEVKDILKQILPQLNDERLDERFKRLENKAISNREKNVAKLFDSISLQGEKLSSTNECRKHGSFGGSYDTDHVFLDKEKHKVKLVYLGRRRFEESLRSLHELCQWGAKDGLNRLRCIHKYFCRDSAILEIEKDESPLIDPHCSLLTIGRCVATNFLHDIDMKCAGTNWCFGACNKDQRPFHPTNNLLRRWLSNETLDSYKSLDSFLSAQDDDTMISAKSSYEPTFVMASARVEISGALDSDEIASHLGNGFFMDSDWVDIPSMQSASNQSYTLEHNRPDLYKDDQEKEMTTENGTEGGEEFQSRGTTEFHDMTDSALGSSTIDSNIAMGDSVLETKSESKSSVYVNNKVSEIKFIQEPCNGHPVNSSTEIKNYSESDNHVLSSSNGDPVLNGRMALENHTDFDILKKSTDSGIEGEVREEILKENIQNECDFDSVNGVGDIDINGGDPVCGIGDLGINGGDPVCAAGDLDINGSDPVINGGGLSHLIETGSLTDPQIPFDSSRGSSTFNKLHTEGQSALSMSMKSNTTTFLERINKPDTASLDSDIDDTPTPSSDTVRKIKVAVFSAADHVCKISPTSPGYKLLRLCQKYSHLDGVIYSLLSGRTVCVVGSQSAEKEIKEVVTALELFLPGYASKFECILPIHHKPLKLPDILKYKLIGVCRHDRRSLDYSIPNSLKQYVTLFDIEKRFIISPVYQGHYVNLLLSHVNLFKSEESFIAYLHSVLLELASEAYMYYHHFCLNSATSRKQTVPLSIQVKGHIRGSKEAFNKLKIYNCDTKIIENLVELISCQQLDLYEPAPSIKVPTEVCQTVRC